MQQAPGNIRALLAPVVESLGYELVGIEYAMQGRNSLLRVYIDSENGITLDDCSRVSHQLSGVLDVEDVIRGEYNLEISSPGLDRPLFTLEHFERFAGHQVNVKLATPIQGRRRFRGLLRGVQDGNIIIMVDDNEMSLPFSTIDKANLVPEL